MSLRVGKRKIEHAIERFPGVTLHAKMIASIHSAKENLP
jgi:hypothetical protein